VRVVEVGVIEIGVAGDQSGARFRAPPDDGVQGGRGSGTSSPSARNVAALGMIQTCRKLNAKRSHTYSYCDRRSTDA
jgi:hypothetical protein